MIRDGINEELHKFIIGACDDGELMQILAAVQSNNMDCTAAKYEIERKLRDKIERFDLAEGLLNTVRSLMI